MLNYIQMDISIFLFILVIPFHINYYNIMLIIYIITNFAIVLIIQLRFSPPTCS